ncbi:CHAT domain-containing protein [Nannocystaceae bacterium ST9]
MSNIAKVSLELLRLGPPHNQLLSPLTRYLGVCGNQPVEEVTVEWEHRDFLSKLAALRYDPHYDKLRLETVHQLGRDMGKIVGRIDGLKKRLAEAHATDIAGLTHLEIVLSASELALLPFELTRTFPGAPGSDEQFLLVQAAVQIEITRRVRGVFEQPIQWPREPKILFIAAQPEGMVVPLQAHLQALLEAVRPFIPFHEDDPQSLLEATREYLHILPRASVAEIEQLCAEVQFSYVHVLAHGLEDPKTPGMPYGLALHAGPKSDEKEIVTGDRLAAALGIADRRPSIVTLAACDSGNVREVIHNGASLAHELHRAGVPLVIGSQFPLSFEASIEMVEQIYQQLPRGLDPRVVVHGLRRRLYARHSTKTHDWASLIVYASLPADLADQLDEVQYRAARLALDATMDRFDRELKRAAADQTAVEKARIDALQDRVDESLARLPTAGAWVLDAEAMRAVAAKRLAQTYFQTGIAQAEDRAVLWEDSLAQLRASRRSYAAAARRALVSNEDSLVRPPVHWLLTQQICLDVVLGRPFDHELWSIAKVAATLDAAHGTPSVQLGALSGLIELHLLLLADDGDDASPHPDAGHYALEHLARLIEETNDTHDFVLYSTRQQLRRYTAWFWNPELIAFQRQRQIDRKLVETEHPIVKLANEALARIAATSDDPKINA